MCGYITLSFNDCVNPSIHIAQVEAGYFTFLAFETLLNSSTDVHSLQIFIVTFLNGICLFFTLS
jgi:hypothetical protein